MSGSQLFPPSLQVPDFVNQPLQTPQLLGYALPATAKFFFT